MAFGKGLPGYPGAGTGSSLLQSPHHISVATFPVYTGGVGGHQPPASWGSSHPPHTFPPRALEKQEAPKEEAAGMRKMLRSGEHMIVRPGLQERVRHCEATGKGPRTEGHSALQITSLWGPTEHEFSHHRVKSARPGQRPCFPTSALQQRQQHGYERGHLGSGAQCTRPWIYIAPFSSKGPLPPSPRPSPQLSEAIGAQTSQLRQQGRETEAEAWE